MNEVFAYLDEAIADGRIKTIPAAYRSEPDPKDQLRAWLEYAMSKRGTLITQQAETRDFSVIKSRQSGWTHRIHTLTIQIPLEEMHDDE